MKRYLALVAVAALAASGCQAVAPNSNYGYGPGYGSAGPMPLARSRDGLRQGSFRSLQFQRGGLYQTAGQCGPGCGCGDTCGCGATCGCGDYCGGGYHGVGCLNGTCPCGGQRGYGMFGSGHGMLNSSVAMVLDGHKKDNVYDFTPGPPVAQTAYPYYTVRGPRDFLLNSPPSIGPY